MKVRHRFSLDVSVKDEIILDNTFFFSFFFVPPHIMITSMSKMLGLLSMLHPQRHAKMCEVYSQYEILSQLKLYMRCQ